MNLVNLHLKPAICIAAICGLVACSHKKSEKELAREAKPKILNVEGYVVTPRPFQNDYTATGSLLPNEEIEILPEVSGRVTSISFEEGKHVSKGQVLVRLYNDDIKAQIQKLHAQRELQVNIKNRQAELLRIGGISKQDYETTTTQIKSIDADISYAEAQLRKTSILAPFDGKVGIRNVSIGAVITPATAIARLQQTRVLKMDFTIPEQYRNEVPTGKKVFFSVTGSFDTLPAVISAIEPKANATTHTLQVRALVQNQQHKLTAGSFTHVIIPFEYKANALMVPSQAVMPTDRDKEVAIVKNGRIKMVAVVIGARTSDMVEVIRGVREGDTIITTGMMQVKPDMAVKVHIAGDRPARSGAHNTVR